MFRMTYNPQALQDWLATINRFVQYRQGVYEALQWSGARFKVLANEGHPPGGHPAQYEDRTGLLTASVGWSIEAMPSWNPATGSAAKLPSLYVFAKAPYADLVEYGTPKSRAYPFFWPAVERTLAEGFGKVASVMARADAIRPEPR